MSTKTKTRLRTVSSFVVSAMTVLTMSGVVYLAPVATNVAQAAVPSVTIGGTVINDGDTIRVNNTFDIYIVKLVGAKKFKRLILNPAIFDSYGQLSWGAVKDVPQSTMDAFQNSNLIIHVHADGTTADPRVWSVTSASNSDIGTKRWLNITAEQFTAAGLDWDSIYKINDLEAADTFYPTGTALTTSDNLVAWATIVTGGGSNVTVPSAGLSVALSGDDPSTKVSAMGAQDVTFSTINVTAGTAGNVKVDSVVVDRGLIGDGGIANDTDFTNVKLYHGSVSLANQLGGTMVLNTTTHTATFTNLNWTINAGTTDKLIITGSLKTTAITGNIMMLGLRSTASIVLDDSTQTVTGTFPMFGSKVQPATIAVGTATIQLLTSPSGNVISGSTEQALATLRFSPTTEDFNLLSVKFTNDGSALPTDLSNLKLMYGSTVIATAASMASNNTVVMSISAPNKENLVKAGTTRDFTLYADISGGVNTSRTIKLSVEQAADVSAQGVTSGGLVTVTAAAVADCQGNQTFPNQGCTITITQGSLSVAISPAFNPAAGNVVVGASKHKMTAIRFSASNNEAVNVTQVTITRTGTSADTDVSSVYLATVNADGSVGATLASGALSSGTVQFGTNTINAFDSTYLFQVPKGGNYDVYVLADVPTSATNNKTIILSIASAANVKGDGVSSLNDLPSASITGTATGNAITTEASGSLTISSSSSTAAATYVKGSTADEFARLTFTADSGEDLTVSSVKITFSSDALSATPLTTANTPTNAKLYKDSVSSGNLLATVATPASGVANFSFTDTILAGTQRTYIVVADIPTTSAATAIYAGIADPNTDVTVTGVSSGASTTTIINSATHVTGNKMTVGVGELGVIMSSLPVYTNITSKTNGAEVGRIILTSSSNGETVRVSTLKVTLAGAANHATNLSIDAAAISNITLYDVNGGDIGGTGVKTMTIGTLTSNAATFSGLQIDVPTGNQRVIGIKVNVGSPADTAPVNIVMGIANYYTDVAASGLSSNSTVYANQLFDAGVAATLFAASTIGDTDLTDNLVDGATELNALGVPALGITAVADGDIVQIESEMMPVTDETTSTVVRNGFAGTTAAAHSTTGVPIILAIGGVSVETADNNLTTNSDTSIVATTTLAGSFRAGQLIAQEDASVAAASDDLKLITAISANGLTLTEADAYAGAVFTEDTSNDQYLVPMTNYGQAQVVQAVGTLTLAASASTPVAKQVLAGTSDVEFSRFNLTSLYEKIDVTKLLFTRTGDTGTDNHLGGGHDSDFASVYLQNLTDSTWGPNGNGKSNTVQLVNGIATFSFSTANALVVDPNNTNGVDIAIKGNLNTTATGVSSGDAPKFYISDTSGASTQITATGESTGTALTTFTDGTPNADAKTSFYAQTIYKGLLSLSLDSASLSGTQTRNSNQAFLTLDASSNASGSVATFRSAALQTADTATTAFSGAFTTAATWTTVVGGGTPVLSTDSTNYVDGAASQRVTADVAAATTGDGLKDTFAATDLSGYAGMAFWIRSNQTAQNFTVSLTGATAGSDTVTMVAANDWELVDIPFTDATTPFTGLTAVTAFHIVVAGGWANSSTLNIDRLMFYKDKMVVSLASNAGLFATTAAHNTASVNLQQGSSVLATAYYSGTTSAGKLTFVPTTQFTIPTAGETLTLVGDTTVLVTAASKTLSSTISLGSADNGGAVTDGQVFWHDGAFALTDNTIRWIYGTVGSISSNISY